jgi:glycosyltransferase involved in cell wall biosynthesis
VASDRAELDVSVIIPACNEGDSLAYLHEEVVAVMEQTGATWELIYVEDGSVDRTFQILEAIAQRDSRVVVIQFRRNFGQTAAIAAGIDHARGAVIVSLDADLQNDPADIPRLLAKLHDGYDVVSGWRKSRVDPLWHRRLPSIVANRVISCVTGLRLHDYGCTLKAYRREVAEHMHLYGEMHRLIPAYAASIGARIAEIPVNHRARLFGRSKYGIARTFKVLLDLLTIKFISGYLTKPIYVFGGWGCALGLVGLALTVVVTVQKVGYQVYVHRNPLIWIAGFCFVSALQLMLMGLLAELIVRTYHESQGKTVYVVRQIVHHNERAGSVRHIGVRG